MEDLTQRALSGGGAAWPANPAAFATRVLRPAGVETRRDIPQSDRDTMPGGDFAGKGTSFPIKTPEDVTAAASSLGRAGDGNYPAAQIKANIIRIAKRKGPAFTAKLPAAWRDGGNDAGPDPGSSSSSSSGGGSRS